MLGKRPRPMIGKQSELLISGSRAGFLDTATSPRSPLDLNLKMQSPRGLKNYDLGGVGLGIVVALDKKSYEGGREVLLKYAISGSNLNRSNPIPVHPIKNQDGFQFRKGGFNEIDVGSLEEDYTYVTSHVPNKTFTKVYFNGGEAQILSSGYQKQRHVEAEPSFPTSDFLSSCHLCRKKLHGKDIYMYRGEKAFCSTECRSSQIMMDERKEQCRSEVSRSSMDVSSSSYTRDQIFSTGILAI
ncbi:DUF581 domain-containing protein [Quillaja saponaria]|uniref:DUF581 domain-containing protein n=1 Tax=Quillaja saponaria TaxID=32244 RepID=A0AAD7LEN1_QUISA|nr:DUF581 domain-containing protein [Quillaja saponaria]